MNTVEILTKTRDLIARPGGWTQRAMRKQNDDGSFCYCLHGALTEAFEQTIDEPTEKDAETIRAFYRADERVRALLREFDCGMSMWRYNDAPGRKQEEVVSILNAAIATESRAAGTR